MLFTFVHLTQLYNYLICAILQHLTSLLQGNYSERIIKFDLELKCQQTNKTKYRQSPKMHLGVVCLY